MLLSALLAITATATPVGLESAALGPCAPNKHTACSYPAKAASSRQIPVGKRCHPDSTRAPGCREVLLSQVAGRSSEVAVAK